MPRTALDFFSGACPYLPHDLLCPLSNGGSQRGGNRLCTNLASLAANHGNPTRAWTRSLRLAAVRRYRRGGYQPDFGGCLGEQVLRRYLHEGELLCFINCCSFIRFLKANVEVMRSKRTISIVGCHAEGEVGDVIIGGVLDIPANNMHDKLLKFMDKHDGLRKFLHHEPRGRLEMSTMIIVPPCDPQADAGFLIMAPGDWVPMSGSNTICTTTVLLETGIVPMKEPVTVVNLDTAAGLVTATAECENGSCKSVAFDNVPAFVWALDMEIDVPGYGNLLVDIAYGGQWYVVVQARDLGVSVTPSSGVELVEIGRLVKKAVLDRCTPTHPENPAIKGINNTIISEPVTRDSTGVSVKHTVIVTPGRLDRSPCGTGSSSRLAILHARGQIQPGEAVQFRSVINTMFVGRIKNTWKVGSYDAVVPTIKGRGWITGEKQVYLDPDDPFPEGFQVNNVSQK